MPSDADTAEILAELRELRAAIKPKRKFPSDHRPLAICRLQPDEIAALDAAAAQRGLSRSELMRQCIASVIGLVIKPRQPTPPGLAAHNRRKPGRFDDGKSDLRQMDRADAAKRVVSARLAAQKAMADYGAAVPNAPVMREIIGETAGVPIVPKLPRAGS